MSATEQIINGLLYALSGSGSKAPSAYDTPATVNRIEDGTAWVHIPGGVDETPVKLTIAAAVGDTVQVRVGGGTAWLVGNATAPPTDDKEAVAARYKAEQAQVEAELARAAALQAQQSADMAASDFALAVLQINSDISDLQSQVDGNITSWFYAYAPTTSNEPAATWILEGTESVHLGDLFYDTTTNYCYRWMSDGATTPTYSWQEVSDSDVTLALANAAAAQDTADSKRRVFITTPTPPYDVGDLWFQGASSDILTCTTAKTITGVYAETDWSKLNKYTDDTALTTFISGAYATDKTNLQSQIDGKAETWYQTTDPASAWTTAALKAAHVGDLWYKSSDGTTWFYKYDDGTSTYKWFEQDVPDAVFDKIDGKAAVFTSQPSPPYAVGDIWFVGATGDILTCTTARATGSYTASDWSKRNKYTDDTAATQAAQAASAAQTSANNAASAAQAAQASADSASSYASQALGNLSTVQSVAETLTWITAHGTMALTTDTAIDPTHVYFVVDANGDYTVGSTHYSIVAEPDADDLSSYYELTIDESLQNYVGTHLSLTSEGLWILPASSGYKVLIATGSGSTYRTAGTYIIDGSGTALAVFSASGIQIGREYFNYAHAKVTYNGLQLCYVPPIAPPQTEVFAQIRNSGSQKTVEELNHTNQENWTYTTVNAITLGTTIKIYERRHGTQVIKTFTAGTAETISMGGYGETLSYDGNHTISYTKEVSPDPDEPVIVDTFYFEQVEYMGVYGSGGTLILDDTQQSEEVKGANTLMVGTGAHAESDNQAVIGKYNVVDSAGEKILILGNGTSSNARSNAFAVNADGDVEMALNTSAAAGTVDGDLYAAITALGWESEVIV